MGHFLVNRPYTFFNLAILPTWLKYIGAYVNILNYVNNIIENTLILRIKLLRISYDQVILK